MGFLLNNRLSNIIYQSDRGRIEDVMFCFLFEFGVVKTGSTMCEMKKIFTVLGIGGNIPNFGEQVYNITF
jgi:hypothetical protein